VRLGRIGLSTPNSTIYNIRVLIYRPNVSRGFSNRAFPTKYKRIDLLNNCVHKTEISCIFSARNNKKGSVNSPLNRKYNIASMDESSDDERAINLYMMSIDLYSCDFHLSRYITTMFLY